MLASSQRTWSWRRGLQAAAAINGTQEQNTSSPVFLIPDRDSPEGLVRSPTCMNPALYLLPTHIITYICTRELGVDNIIEHTQTFDMIVSICITLGTYKLSTVLYCHLLVPCTMSIVPSFWTVVSFRITGCIIVPTLNWPMFYVYARVHGHVFKLHVEWDYVYCMKSWCLGAMFVLHTRTRRVLSLPVDF